MSELITPSGRVHWIGTGMSTGSGLGIVCDNARVTLWGRTRDKARACLDRLGLAGRAEPAEFDLASLVDDITPGDVVVSMLPAAHHAAVLRTCLDHGAHFVCSSYVSAEMSSMAATAARAGLVVLTECGLDPGIDHLLAHQLVDQARDAIGDRPAVAEFTSYCGSNPAVGNDFRYRFSWAPKGVLTALLTPARYIHQGTVQAIDHPWEAVRAHDVGGERFEVYPNRDSVRFVDVYGFPGTWRLEEFIRGTIRLDGWSRAWAPVFSALRDADDDRIGALAEDLAARYPTSESDHDRIVLVVSLDVRADDGTNWSGEYVLDVVGDSVESATPRLVSVAMAGGIRRILESAIPPGAHRATDDLESICRWLDFLRDHDIICEFRRNPRRMNGTETTWRT